MLFSTAGQAILVAHERRSRLTLIARPPAKPPDRKAHTTANALADMLAPMPDAYRQTLTFDNPVPSEVEGGTEFAQHHRVRDQIGIQTFFCDTHSPWQKGSVENAIGRLRRSLPRKTDLATLSLDAIDAISRRYNNTPRKCLDFQTPPRHSSTNRCTSNVNLHGTLLRLEDDTPLSIVQQLIEDANPPQGDNDG